MVREVDRLWKAFGRHGRRGRREEARWGALVRDIGYPTKRHGDISPVTGGVKLASKYNPLCLKLPFHKVVWSETDSVEENR